MNLIKNKEVEGGATFIDQSKVHNFWKKALKYEYQKMNCMFQNHSLVIITAQYVIL